MKILWTKKQEEDFLIKALEEFARNLKSAAKMVQAKNEKQVDFALPPPPFKPEPENFEFKGYL